MQLTTTDNFFFLSRAESDASLRIDRRTGALRELVLETSLDVPSVRIEGVLGVCRLVDSNYLVTISESRPTARIVTRPLPEQDDIAAAAVSADVAATVAGVHDVFRVGGVGFTRYRNDAIGQAGDSANDAEYLRLFKSALASDSFYYSPTYDITNSAQRLATHQDHDSPHADEIKSSGTDPPRKSVWDGADERFIWNRYLCEPFLEDGFESWVTPVMDGYIHSDSVPFGPDSSIHFVLFSRRSTRHAGTRFNTRGLTREGSAANFVELEQLVVVTTPRHESDATGQVSKAGSPDVLSNVVTYVASFVQTRGSVPILWRQRACLIYAPQPRVVGSEVDSKESFERHFDEQTKVYGRQIVVNLINQSGRESVLFRAFTRLAEHPPKLRADAMPDADWLDYHPFDFHHECRKLQFDNVYHLVEDIRSELDRMGFFLAEHAGNAEDMSDSSSWSPTANWRILSTQKSVIRTNCMDNLDRTNVAQSAFARVALKAQLEKVGVARSLLRPSNPDRSLAQAPPKFSQRLEALFRNAWADNADVLSLRYAGTNAQKTDFTRTGTRTYMGLVRDGVASLSRYYLNNFRDGERQDAVDLLLGNFDPSRDHPKTERAPNDLEISSNSKNAASGPLMHRHPDPVFGGFSGWLRFWARVWLGAASVLTMRRGVIDVLEDLVDVPLLCEIESGELIVKCRGGGSGKKQN